MKIFGKVSIILLAWVFPLLVHAQADPVRVPNPIDAISSGDATVIEIISVALAGLAGVFGVFALGFLLINSFRLIVSAGNEEAITNAKKGLTWSAVSLVISIFAYSIVAAVSDIFGGTGDDELADPDKLAPPTRDSLLENVFVTFFTNLTVIVGVAAALMIVYSGFRMIFSSGNEEQVTQAKTVLKWAVVGLVVAGLSFTIISAINSALVN